MTQIRTPTRPLAPSLPMSDETTARAFLGLVLVAALAVRLFVVATQTYVVHPDETFQYLEPAHRLVFGSGLVTWEYLEGIRSWLLPGVIAGIIWAVSLVDPEPAAYVMVLRLLCTVASLSVPFVGFQLTARRFGPTAALLVGLLCALALNTVYFAPVIMTEPLATYVGLLAIWLGDGTGGHPPEGGRLLATGLLFGLAISLRYQYAPAFGAAALLQHARAPRDLGLVAIGAVIVVASALGLLDQLTWGTPFQSVWLNYFLNATQHISSAFGTHPWWYYGLYYYLTCIAASPLLAFACFGAVRMPVLGAVVLCTVVPHSLIAHKEPRFVFLATACMPMLIGIGLAALLHSIPKLRTNPAGAAAAAAVALAVGGGMAVATYRTALGPDAWDRERSMLQAIAAARVYPGACGLGVRGAWWYVTGGYTYWHRDLPMYFEVWDDAQKIEGTTFRLRLENVLAGHDVPTYPGSALAANTDKFNLMVGRPNDALPGFSNRICYGIGSADDPTYCVYVRPGGCT